MARLLFYWDEWNLYPHYYDTKLNQKETTKIVKKLCRHFKLPMVRLFFSNRKRGGSYTSWGYLTIGASTNLGILCHELGHHYTQIKYRECKHNKKLRRAMKVICNYASRWLAKETEVWGDRYIGNDIY